MSQELETKFRELLREYVLEVLEEQTDRSKYIDDLYNCMVGALGEYYKARYAEVNGNPDPDTTAHWDREVDEHFSYKFDQIVGRRRRAGKDHRKAFVEALEDLRTAVPAELRRSRNEFCKDYNINPKTAIDPSDGVTDEFFARAENEYDNRT